MGVSLSLNHRPQAACNALCLHGSVATRWGRLSEGDTPTKQFQGNRLLV